MDRYVHVCYHATFDFLKAYKEVVHLRITGWPKSKFVISKSSVSKLVHIWPHNGKAKMCLRGGSFFQCQLIFSSIWNITMKNDWVFNHPLWSRVKALDCHAVSPGFESLWQQNVHILEKLAIFFEFLKNLFSTKETATSKTHFGFTNLWWNMYQFGNGAIWNNKFWFGSPCSWKLSY